MIFRLTEELFRLTEAPFKLTKVLFRLTEVLFRLAGVTFRHFAISCFKHAPGFLFAERVLVPNVSHENHLIFMRMTVQVTYIFIPIVSLKEWQK